FSEIRIIIGEAKDCIGVMDACSPTIFYTKDGLYAGSVMEGRFDESLPSMAYTGGNTNDNQWADLIEDPKGDVYWTVGQGNNTNVYKIHGFDGWKRTTGKLSIKTPVPAAAWKGTGLKGDYFANQELSGKPALTRVDPAIWFGTLIGDHWVPID